VIGLGAIGGSLAWQSRLAGVPRVVGYSPERGEGIQALKASAITELADTPAAAVRGADLVVLAVPPRPTLDLIARLAPFSIPTLFSQTSAA
jgi:prephenate dehydrogenase